MPAMAMKHDADPAQEMLAKLGNLSAFQPTHNNVLVAIYDRPAQTKSGIVLPDQYRDEERFQGKAALIVAKGPTAFRDAEGWNFASTPMDVGDWIAMRPSDGWSISVNKVLCRMIPDTAIRAKIASPDVIW
jgi:co-chaperonin GroES (HSP10)